MNSSRLKYYLRSLFTLLLEVHNPIPAFASLIGFPIKSPFKMTLRNSGHTFLVRNFMDLWILKETCLDGEYDDIFPEEGSVGVLLDIGAGIGDFTIHFAERFPTWRVIAFEPLADAFILLEENVRNNHIESVDCQNVAVCSQPGPVTLHEGRRGPISAIASPTGLESSKPKLGEAVGVSFEDILDEIPNGTRILIKMDCEGSEFDILLNCSTKILSRIEAIAVECHDWLTEHSSEELIELLKRSGFTVKCNEDGVHTDQKLVTAQRSRHWI